MELRCPGNKLHGRVLDGEEKPQGSIEFRCSSRWCGAGPGTVVLHRFDLGTGDIHTLKYREPPTPRRKE